jgi:hypothetical protein
MSRSAFDLVLDVVDALPEATRALDNEECRLDYVTARDTTIVAHGWTPKEFDIELCKRMGERS